MMLKRCISLLLALCLAAAVCGCSSGTDTPSAPEASSADAASSAVVSTETVSSGDPESAQDAAQEPSSAPAVEASEAADDAQAKSGNAAEDAETKTATLYIGMDGQFQEYPVEYSGELTPLFLVAQISELTGWNLDLADEITSGKGGMTVSFAETSSLVSGPPETQDPDFFVYDSHQLVRTILDSVQHTLQYNFVDPSLGDPSSLDIYFNLDGEAIVIPDSGETIDPYAPYEPQTEG